MLQDEKKNSRSDNLQQTRRVLFIYKQLNEISIEY